MPLKTVASAASKPLLETLVDLEDVSRLCENQPIRWSFLTQPSITLQRKLRMSTRPDARTPPQLGSRARNPVATSARLLSRNSCSPNDIDALKYGDVNTPMPLKTVASAAFKPLLETLVDVSRLCEN